MVFKNIRLKGQITSDQRSIDHDGFEISESAHESAVCTVIVHLDLVQPQTVPQSLEEPLTNSGLQDGSS
jgi:hypothetical protein